MERFRTLIDLNDCQLNRQAESFITPESKRALVRTLYEDMQTNAGATPVMVCIQKLATSLAQIFIGEKDRLDLPLPGLPLDMAATLQDN